MGFLLGLGFARFGFWLFSLICVGYLVVCRCLWVVGLGCGLWYGG